MAQPIAAHQHWRIDVPTATLAVAFCDLCSILDGFSRHIVNWDIRESMTEADIEIILQGRSRSTRCATRVHLRQRAAVDRKVRAKHRMKWIPIEPHSRWCFGDQKRAAAGEHYAWWKTDSVGRQPPDGPFTQMLRCPSRDIAVAHHCHKTRAAL